MFGVKCMVLVFSFIITVSKKTVGGKDKGIMNDTRTHGSYMFGKVRKSRSTLFGKEDLMRDSNEMIHETLKGPRKRDAAVLFELVSNARCKAGKIMPEKSLTMKFSR